MPKRMGLSKAIRESHLEVTQDCDQDSYHHLEKFLLAVLIEGILPSGYVGTAGILRKLDWARERINAVALVFADGTRGGITEPAPYPDTKPIKKGKGPLR